MVSFVVTYNYLTAAHRDRIQTCATIQQLNVIKRERTHHSLQKKYSYDKQTNTSGRCRKIKALVRQS